MYGQTIPGETYGVRTSKSAAMSQSTMNPAGLDRRMGVQRKVAQQNEGQRGWVKGMQPLQVIGEVS